MYGYSVHFLFLLFLFYFTVASQCSYYQMVSKKLRRGRRRLTRGGASKKSRRERMGRRRLTRCNGRSYQVVSIESRQGRMGRRRLTRYGGGYIWDRFFKKSPKAQKDATKAQEDAAEAQEDAAEAHQAERIECINYLNILEDIQLNPMLYKQFLENCENLNKLLEEAKCNYECLRSPIMHVKINFERWFNSNNLKVYGKEELLTFYKTLSVCLKCAKIESILLRYIIVQLIWIEVHNNQEEYLNQEEYWKIHDKYLVHYYKYRTDYTQYIDAERSIVAIFAPCLKPTDVSQKISKNLQHIYNLYSSLLKKWPAPMTYTKNKEREFNFDLKEGSAEFSKINDETPKLFGTIQWLSEKQTLEYDN